MTVDFISDAMPPRSDCGDRRGTRSRKRIENGVADETEHANKTVRERYGKRRWMIGLSEESSAAIVDFMNDIRDLVPDDWSEIVETDFTAMLLDRRVQRNNRVPTVVLPAGKAYATDDTDQTPTRDKCIETTPPDPVELGKKAMVVVQMAKLSLGVAVFLECPAGRRRKDKVNRILIDADQLARVAMNASVECRNLTDYAVQFRKPPRVSCKFGNRRLQIDEVAGPIG